MGELLSTQAFTNKRRRDEINQLIDDKNKEIKPGYQNQINQFVRFCEREGLQEDAEAMIDFLYTSIVVEEVKKTTWELRLVSVRRYLAVTYGIDTKGDKTITDALKTFRDMFNHKERAHQIRIEGKSAGNKNEILEMINKLPTRPKAITFVNLITANRPSEMVSMRIRDFNLEAREVGVYLEKQSKWHTKRLHQEVVKAVRDYIREFKLKPDDYFVGRYNYRKSGKYESVEISEIGYTKALQSWTGLTAYNFRKTQVVAMHEAGADLPTIAKQTGHNSLEVL